MVCMKIKWEFIVIIALLLLIVGGIIFWPKPQPSETIQNARDSISQLLEANVVNSMRSRTLETRLVQMNLKFSRDSARFYREITVKNQQLARKRVQIDTLILENPNLASYMQTADSVFSMMHSRIDSLEASKAFQVGLYTDLIRIKDKQIQNLTYISGQQGVIIADLEKQVRKKRRGNKLWKAAAVTLGISGILVGSQL